MSIKPKPIVRKRLQYFEESGSNLKKYPLLKAVYEDDTAKARGIIETDPDQINQQDPFAGLTALHIAVFRQNEELVRILTAHPRTDMSLKDVFRRSAVDMLDYTTNHSIFLAVMDRAYPEVTRDLLFGDDDDDGGGGSTIVQMPPRPRR